MYHDDEDDPQALLKADPNLATEGDKEAADEAALRRQREQLERNYDVPEVNVLQRMKRVMIRRHGYEPEDFAGCSFTEIESMFLDDCGEEDFRGDEG